METNKKTRLKTRTPISNAIDNEIYKQLQELTKETRISISKLLDEAISDLIKKYKKS